MAKVTFNKKETLFISKQDKVPTMLSADSIVGALYRKL